MICPKTGKTWAGFGRAPGWIAGAKNREAFLVDKSGAKSPDAALNAPVAKKKRTAKKESAKKVVKPTSKKSVAVAKKAAMPTPAKKMPLVKSAASKVVAKKSAKKRALPVSAVGALTVADSAAHFAT